MYVVLLVENVHVPVSTVNSLSFCLTLAMSVQILFL